MHRKIKATADLMEKYHMGLATLEESQVIESWLDDNIMEIQPAKLSAQTRKEKKKSIWRGIIHKRGSNKVTSRLTNRKLFIVAATVFAGILLTSYIFFFSTTNTTHPEIAVHYQILQSQYGQKVRIKLTDSTTIHLNAGSTLTYPDQFSGKERVVQLQGEAYFEVAKNKEKPFIIQTKNGVVRVLGTKFNLKAFDNDHTESLSLDEGSVKYSDLKDTTNFVILSPRQHVVLNDADNSFMVRLSNVQDVAWLKNQLAFKNLPIEEIAKQIERWYGVTVTVKNHAIGSQRYTGVYDDPPLNKLLEQLSYVMGFKYSILNKKEVTIR